MVQSDTNLPGQSWPSPKKLAKGASVVPMSSFEMEDNTAGSGGTSWTLRVPWLRSKRPRKQRQDDENSSIQTDISRSVTKSVVATGNSEDQVDVDAMYYGGLMKTSSPTFVSIEAEQIEALEGDGLYRTENLDSSAHRVLQQQRQPRRQSKQKRRLSKKGSRRAAQEMNQDLLPQHNSPLPTATNAATKTRRQFFFFSSKKPHLVPKNNNKVFRNRSWISTSSRESEARDGKRSKDEDSLADFDDAEWTPQDSAYGAAIPVCGWVPKRLRQGIEATLIAITVFALVYLVVTTSIQISEHKADRSRANYNDTYFNSNKDYNNGLATDDDWYVENSIYQNDEDDYFNSNGNKNDNGGDQGDANDNDHGG